MDVPKEERLARYQELYDRGGFALWLGNYRDSFMSQDAADEVAEFLATKIRERVTDPEIAEKLIPKHTFGTKRCPGEKNYYETFNRNNVRLVDLRETPIKKITHTGIETGNELHELDVIIYATGFHSVTGELLRMDIRGQHGRSLARALVRRAKNQPRRSVLGLPKPVGHHGAPQPGGVLQHPPLRRDQRRVDRRLHPLYARERLRSPKQKTHGPSAATNRPKGC
jgi:cation diffusion facilitator CzcD-associated flavoprotein CzcO